MSYQDYQQSKELTLADPPFYAMVIAASLIPMTTDVDREKVVAAWAPHFDRQRDAHIALRLTMEFIHLSFAAFLMALMRKADSDNFEKIKLLWPEIHAEMQARYDSPGGILRGETV